MHKRYDTENRGCKEGCERAIDWFFMNENDGIIIEDDIAPSESFIKYCEELLDAYRKDKRIGMICGTSYHSIIGLTGDYTFGRIGHVWGWATWSDRWPTKQDREKYLNEGCTIGDYCAKGLARKWQVSCGTQ